MTERIVKFDVDGPPTIDVSITAGNVIVRPGTEGKAKVMLSGAPELVDGASVDITPDSVTIRSARQEQRRRFSSEAMDVAINVPDGVRVRVRIGAGDVRLRVDAEDVDISSGMGDVRIDNVTGHARIKVASGDINVTRCDGEFNAKSASGDIRVDHVGGATVKTASGDVVIGQANDIVQVRSASGNVKVRDFRGSDLDISTMSGNVFVGLAPGRIVEASIKTLSGDFRNKVKPGDGDRTDTMALNVSSFSGDVTLTSAK
ncbi:MAG: hypothetical protein DRQ98_13830 [Gammaproteobacteria bacterium]|nr:MAG: hypothetical protein DRQ98_13830 [Gammaproteobacteria bacterium]